MKNWILVLILFACGGCSWNEPEVIQAKMLHDLGVYQDSPYIHKTDGELKKILDRYPNVIIHGGVYKILKTWDFPTDSYRCSPHQEIGFRYTFKSMQTLSQENAARMSGFAFGTVWSKTNTINIAVVETIDHKIKIAFYNPMDCFTYPEMKDIEGIYINMGTKEEIDK